MFNGSFQGNNEKSWVNGRLNNVKKHHFWYATASLIQQLGHFRPFLTLFRPQISSLVFTNFFFNTPRLLKGQTFYDVFFAPFPK